MTTEERCTELKNKYYDKLKTEQISAAKILDRAIYEGQYTEKEIDELIEYKDYEAEFEESVKGLYDPGNIHNHDCIIGETDIKALSQDMAEVEYETMRLYLFGNDNTFLGCFEGSSKEALSIPKETVDNLCRKAIMAENCAGIAVVHNHPFVAVAEPSTPDGISAIKRKEMFGFFGITILDDCIITGADFFSRKTADSVGKTEYRVFSPLSEELENLLERENKLFFRALEFTNVLS